MRLHRINVRLNDKEKKCLEEAYITTADIHDNKSDFIRKSLIKGINKRKPKVGSNDNVNTASHGQQQ